VLVEVAPGDLMGLPDKVAQVGLQLFVRGDEEIVPRRLHVQPAVREPQHELARTGYGLDDAVDRFAGSTFLFAGPRLTNHGFRDAAREQALQGAGDTFEGPVVIHAGPKH